MCSAAPSKKRRFKVRFQGIVGMDGPVAGLHGSRLTHFRHGVLRVFRVAGEVQFAGGTGARPDHPI